MQDLAGPGQLVLISRHCLEAREGHQVRLKLVEVHVELALEAQRRHHRRTTGA